MKKRIIKELVIVEGKTDSCKLKKLFYVQTYETQGSSLNQKKINDIIYLSKNKGIILFFDPDFTGEKIRKNLIEKLTNTKNVFLNKEKDFLTNKKNKFGVAEADDEAIIKAFENAATFISKNNQTINWLDYLCLNLDSNTKREKFCNHLNISCSNNKQLFKRINMMELSYEDCKNILILLNF